MHDRWSPHRNLRGGAERGFEPFTKDLPQPVTAHPDASLRAGRARREEGHTTMSVRTDQTAAPEDRAAATDPGFGHLYAQVQQFYARQMQLLDSGAAEEWAATFTEDGTFARPSSPEPARGHAELAAGARAAAERLAAEGLSHRHVIGMTAVRREPDGSVFVRSYAQVFATRRGKLPGCI
ncbi:nuclear transport factor 2 family protein [Streptomyces nogalater]